jgi:capsid protein
MADKISAKQKYWENLTMSLKPESTVKDVEVIRNERQPSAAFFGSSSGSTYNLYPLTFNGEKNLGEIGPIKNYRPDYVALRLRSWQAYLENDIAQTILKKFTKWIVGSGLKLQAEPNKIALESEGIKLKTEDFNEIVEARFSVYANSTSIDYSGRRNLHSIAERVFLESKIGGDILVVLRYINDQYNIQMIDGVHVTSPVYGDEYFPQALNNGNEIRNGIELSPKGEHIAYYVRKGWNNGIPANGSFEVERIPAKTDSGLTVAYLVYGLEYRLDGHRGLPLISALLETLKKLERYKEATLGSAEERQKIAYFIEHSLGSTGENPIIERMAVASGFGTANSDIPIDEKATEFANKVAATTNKQVFNMPQESTIKSVESKSELYFKDFITVLANLICSAVEIPPDVAFSKYDSNFSASRAALKDWEHTINVERKKFQRQFYQHVYNFFLDVEIMKNKVQAPGYLLARISNNTFVLEAFRNARFVGSSVPHIDPLKEVNAERAKLGPAGAMIPLTTIEAATEALNGGESDQNILQFSEEMKEAKRLGIIQPPKTDKQNPKKD